MNAFSIFNSLEWLLKVCNGVSVLIVTSGAFDLVLIKLMRNASIVKTVFTSGFSETLVKLVWGTFFSK